MISNSGLNVTLLCRPMFICKTALVSLAYSLRRGGEGKGREGGGVKQPDKSA